MKAFIKSATLAICLSISSSFAFGQCQPVTSTGNDKTDIAKLIEAVNCLVKQPAQPTVSVEGFDVPPLNGVKKKYSGKVLAAIMTVPNAGTLIVSPAHPQSNLGPGPLNTTGLLNLGADGTITAQWTGSGQGTTAVVIYQQ